MRNRIGDLFRNLRDYVQSMLARRKRRKQEKKEDPFIYQHY